MVDEVRKQLAEENRALRKRELSEIRQGVKSSVETVPMPVRMEASQIKALKILAAMEGTTVSSILRQCIADRIEASVAANPTYAEAIRQL